METEKHYMEKLGIFYKGGNVLWKKKNYLKS